MENLLPKPAFTTRIHYPHINLLRGFAALSVLVYHVIELGGWSTTFPIDGLLVWFRTGWMAVDLFLVISGFVITLSLQQWLARDLSFRDTFIGFMKQRWWRIAPLYLFTGVCYLLGTQPDYFQQHDAAWKFVLSFVTFTQNISMDLAGNINGTSWSVALEMQFYIFLAATLWWLQKRPVWQVVSILVLASWAWRSVMWHLAEKSEWESFKRFYYTIELPAVLDEFAMGIALALLVRHCKISGAFFAAAVCVGLPIFSLYWQYANYWDVEYMVRFWRTGLALFFGLILAVAVSLPAFAEDKTPLWYHALYYLGDISYGIYLWHLMVILVLQQFFTFTPPQLLLATLTAVLPLAALSWHGIEKPFIAYGKKRSAT